MVLKEAADGCRIHKESSFLLSLTTVCIYNKLRVIGRDEGGNYYYMKSEKESFPFCLGHKIKLHFKSRKSEINVFIKM